MDRLIPKEESLTIEFKSDRKKLSDDVLIDTVVAFANTEGGDLYLGVEDNGEVTGRHESHRDFSRLAAFIANKTIPPIAVRVEEIADICPVIKIQVPKSRSIVASSAGKIQRRQIKMDGTPENVAMYPYEISTRLSELSLLDYSAQPVPNARYEDLDPLERERLRNILRTYNGERSLLELEDEALDKALQLVTTADGQLVPTFTGMLLLGRREKLREYVPTAEIGYMAFHGTDVTANESFYMPLLGAIEKLFAFLEARNSEQEMQAGLFRISIPDFDRRAVREAIINACVHRDYTRMGRVLVRLDDDGLSVSNPGGFIEGVTIDNILSAEPHGRNPVLADALKRVGLAERSGRGVDRIFEGSLLYGRPLPDYSESSAVTVKLFISRGAPDIKFIQLVTEEQQRTGSLLPVNTLLILNVLKQGRRMSVHDIASETRIPEGRVRTAVERMTGSGLLEAVGSGKGRAYILSFHAYEDKVKYVRQTDIEAIRYQELIVKLAEAKQQITRKDVVDLLRVTPPQAYRILQKMTRSGLLMKKGSTRSTYYCRGKTRT
ncbi:MAG: AAA family ATPase [Oscillospiraceae bacterium]|nr:AAA family ATPase [Oscillospiraceae bacterium]